MNPPTQPSATPEPKPITSLNAEEAERMVDEFWKPSATPRTQAQLLPINSHTLPHDVVYASFARTLETELAEANNKLTLYRSKVFRMKSILASIDDDGTEQHNSVTAERAEAEVLAQAALLGRSAEREADLLGKLSRAEHALAAARKDSERLDWLERFLQIGGSSVFTSATGQAQEDRPDDTEETRWNHPFCIGYEVEQENRGCYRWEEKSNGAKGIRPAIDAAMTNSNHKTT